MRQVNQQSLDMFAQYPDRHLIHFIVNANGQEKNEGGLTQIRRIYTILDHAQMGWIILVVDKPLIRFVCNIVLKIGKPQSRILFLDNMDDWQSTLQERDSTLDWNRLNPEVIAQFESEIESS